MGADGDVPVRAAQVADAEGIARVQIASWRQAYAGIMDPGYLAGLDLPRRTEVWRRLLVDGASLAVAERAGAVVGFAAYGPSMDDDTPDATSDGTGMVYAIYVDPQMQGSGIGTALMNRAVADLGARGYAEAVLWVFEANGPARRFYAKGGWRPDGTERDEAWGDRELRELRYRRPLAATPGP
jgi:ribosomal protein S18 acetylase RimI-like enzyme